MSAPAYRKKISLLRPRTMLRPRHAYQFPPPRSRSADFADPGTVWANSTPYGDLRFGPRGLSHFGDASTVPAVPRLESSVADRGTPMKTASHAKDKALSFPDRDEWPRRSCLCNTDARMPLLPDRDPMCHVEANLRPAVQAIFTQPSRSRRAPAKEQ